MSLPRPPAARAGLPVPRGGQRSAAQPSHLVESPHALPVAEIAARLEVDPAAGLDDATAARRLAEYGANELEPPRRTSILATVFEAATEPFVLVLLAAGALALLLGEVRDGLLVLLGLIPIVGADVVTQYRGERAMEALRFAAAPKARVRRGGRALDRPAGELVPGDLVLLRVGDVVPADLRIVSADALAFDRSILTGESLPEAGTVIPDQAATDLADRRSIAYAGTSVVQGHGEGIVVATGPMSELGRIAGELGPTDRGRSPLQRELDRLVGILVVVAGGLIVVAVSANLLRGASPGAALLAGIAAAIAAIPEEPPVLLAVVLGLGAYRLLRHGVLVRRLSAQETLGAVDLIVTDKTGTLTENRLALEAVVTPNGAVSDAAERAQFVHDALRAEHDAWSLETGARSGSFTRGLLAAVGEERRPRLDRAELVDADGPQEGRPYSRTRTQRNGGLEELALGAPEALLELVGDTSDVEPWRDLVHGLAGRGGRLLLLVRRVDDGPWHPRAVFAFSDPLRSDIPAALRSANEAGIQTMIVTGDHPATAGAIAAAAGLTGGAVITGAELGALDDDAVRALMPRLQVVARASPEDKLRLVTLARAAGRTVAVTGDGVNDAPALNRADVGVAMGSGTAVAREASDLVLGDDSFVTLLNGLAEGRRIVANVQKGLVFLTSTHVALLGFVLIATLAGFGQPLLPIQILWLELFIDLAASVAFEREPAEPDAMQRPPRPRGVPLLTREILLRVSVAGGFTAVAALAVIEYHGGGADHARWLAFNALVFGQLVRAYANRSLDHPVTALPRNGFLALACVVAAVVQFVIPIVPPLAEAFRASPLDAVDVLIVTAIALLPAALAEAIRMRGGRNWVA